MTRQIIGSKGGGGGASFITKPDSLRSNDSFEILLGLGSGRWKGLVNGLKGLKINGVPMENPDGTSNFQDIYAIFADGNPLEQQLVTFKLGGGASSTTINTQLSNSNVGSPGPWISGVADTIGANFVDLRFVAQQLFYQDKKSIRENTATIEIEMRPSGTATWINPLTAPNSSSVTYDQNGYDYNDPEFQAALYTAYFGRGMFNDNGVGFRASASSNLPITGKTTSAFVKEIRIAVPNAGAYANKTWEVRARLIEKDTVDNNDIQERRNILFESIAGIKNEPLGDHPDWTGLVWMQIHGKASDQFNGFPEIEGIFDTKICKVPPTAVFNPDTRAYTNAVWDGSYEERYTNDPAWQIKEFIEDPIHGLAGLQPGSTVDKWDALEASKYYSELVPDGKGGTHPRFSMNLTINESRDVDEMVGYLSGAVNSYMEDVGGGVWRLKVDKPETPTMLFTQDNIFGEFNYSHTDVDTRFNDWRGTFIDEDLGYEVNTARVFDQDDIDENGLRFTEVALVGCTNHQEALRRLMFRMRVSLNEYKVVSFQTNRLGRYISPLSTILIADGGLNADHLVKSTSRLNMAAGTTVNLLRPVRLEVGVNYVMHFTTKSGETITRTVTNGAGARGDTTVISIDTALPVDVLAESAVALEAVGLPANPVSYRVMGVERSEEDEDSYTIVASIIDSGKWNAMDNVSSEELAAQEAEVAIDAPTAAVDGMFETLAYATEFDLKRVLQVNWNRPGGKYLDGYRVEYSFNDGPLTLLAAKLKDSIYEFENPEDGKYTFRIVALDRRGVESEALVGSYDIDGSREFRAPTHIRGELADRPPVAPYEGFRFTVTDSDPPVTQVWEDGNWRDEVNLVTEGSQIGVENGATVGMTDTEAAEAAILAAAVADLEIVYGDTVSAAASALAANDSAIAAAASLAASEAARVLAEAAATNAAADEVLALAHKNAALAAATSASGSATIATGQATIATDAASAAATSETLSAGHASTASTQAGISTSQAVVATGAASTATTQAGISAGHASTASTQAGISTTQAGIATAAGATATTQASLSATYRQEAQDATVQTFPTNFNSDSLYFVGDAAASSAPNGIVYVTDGTYGRVAQNQAVGSYGAITRKGRSAQVDGKKWKVRALVRHVSGTPDYFQLRVDYYTSPAYDGVSRVDLQTYYSPVISSTTPGWIEHTFDTTGKAFPFIAPNIVLNTSGIATQQVLALEMIDVTESTAAANSASVSSTAAATATGAASSATTQASLAATFATGAENILIAGLPASLDPIGRLGYRYNSAPTLIQGPLNVWPQSYITEWSGASISGTETAIKHKAYIPRQVGRKYRMTCWVFSYNTNVGFYMAFVGCPGESEVGAVGLGHDNLGPDGNQGVLPNGPGWVKLSIERTFTALDPAYWITLVSVNYSAAVPTPHASSGGNTMVHTTGIVVEDITESTSAASQATISTSQAAIATAAASTATTQSGLAAGHASTAATQAGIATSEAAAATSAAATATSNSTLTASYLDASREIFYRSYPKDLAPVNRDAYSFSTPSLAIAGPNAGWPQSYISSFGLTELNGNQIVQSFNKKLSRQVGRRYRATSWMFSYNTNVDAYLGFFGFDTEGGAGQVYIPHDALGPGGIQYGTPGLGWTKYSIEFVSEASDPALWVPFFVINPTLVVPSSHPSHGGNNTVHTTGIVIEDITESASAATSATVATSQAAVATAQAAVATSRAVLAASLSGGAVNKNPDLSVYPDGSNIPTGWNVWPGAGGDVDLLSQYTTYLGASGLQISCPADRDIGVFQNLTVGEGWWVIEVRADYIPSYSGAGVYISWLNNASVSVGDSFLSLSDAPQIVGNEYHWRFAPIQAPAEARSCNFHLLKLFALVAACCVLRLQPKSVTALFWLRWKPRFQLTRRRLPPTRLLSPA
jgi:predicted phage tail protein